MRGVDFDVTVVPTEYLELSATGAYINNIFTKWPVLDPSGSGGVIGDRAKGSIYLGSPKLKIILAGVVQVPVPEDWGGLDFNADYTHTGVKCYDTTVTTDSPLFHPFSYQTAANGYGPRLSASLPTKISSSCQAPFHEVNMGVTWKDLLGTEGLTLSGGITNVTKTTGSYNTGVAWYQIGFHLTQAPQPRSFYVGARYSF